MHVERSCYLPCWCTKTHTELHGYSMAENGGLKAGYGDSIVDRDSKNRYIEKLKVINGQDPYELPKHTWQDDISLWPSITYVNVCLYLILRTKSIY